MVKFPKRLRKSYFSACQTLNATESYPSTWTTFWRREMFNTATFNTSPNLKLSKNLALVRKWLTAWLTLPESHVGLYCNYQVHANNGHWVIVFIRCPFLSSVSSHVFEFSHLSGAMDYTTPQDACSKNYWSQHDLYRHCWKLQPCCPSLVGGWLGCCSTASSSNKQQFWYSTKSLLKKSMKILPLPIWWWMVGYLT